jgi:hypothetical protein
LLTVFSIAPVSILLGSSRAWGKGDCLELFSFHHIVRVDFCKEMARYIYSVCHKSNFSTTVSP